MARASSSSMQRANAAFLGALLLLHVSAEAVTVSEHGGWSDVLCIVPSHNQLSRAAGAPLGSRSDNSKDGVAQELAAQTDRFIREHTRARVHVHAAAS
jgi:hypothetical protein